MSPPVKCERSTFLKPVIPAQAGMTNQISVLKNHYKKRRIRRSYNSAS